MIDEDTIVAVASPRGAGAGGIVRLSGPRAVELVSRFLEAPIPGDTYVRLEARFALPDAAAFPVAVYVMRRPRSYTREDVVEVHAPGAPALLSAMVEAACRAGARIAEPGEFTRRAFLSGRIDLAQAEAVLSLIRARTNEEERLALSALAGGLSREVRRIRGAIMTLDADIEAGLDFHDGEANFAPPERQAGEIARTESAISALLDESSARRVFREEVLAVLYGPVNAGKSSIFNMLAGADVAIVHHSPGTTRDVLEAPLRVEGTNVLLLDTAGVRAPAEVVEEIAVARAERSAGEAQIVLFVVDASAALTREAEVLYDKARGAPHVVILNKSDKGLALDARAWRARYGDVPTVEASAVTRRGKDEILRALSGFVLEGRVDLSAMRFLLEGRQRLHLERAREALRRAARAVEVSAGDEIVSLELAEAAVSLGRVTGEDYTGDLLDDIFSRFCLGK